ncbi:MAG: SDR family oxidoreductase [Leptospiraceae bacterium]|nr:SDR family oxidoreductase [Leptospiraceae bacterium]
MIEPMNALVTGASSGIGLEITKKLLEMGISVYGVSRTNPGDKLPQENFHFIEADLSNSKDMQDKLIPLSKSIPNINILINSAGVGIFGLHEELDFKELENMMYLNLVTPILITRIFLRKMKKIKGTIINISSMTSKKSSPLASAYSATKAGLSKFGESLFEEGRKSGLRVINIHPDITKTNFYNNSWFKEEDNPLAYLFSEDISKLLPALLNSREGVVISDITIQPQLHRIHRKGKTDPNKGE